MPHHLTTPESQSAALRKAASAMKAAAVVCAAAILSQAEGDLRANAAAAGSHLDDVARQMHALRGDRAAGGSAQRDQALHAVETAIADVRQVFLEVVGHAQRDGLDIFVARVGDLGRALQDVMAIVDASLIGTPPFQFDQFFLESMRDLAQRDWSPVASSGGADGGG